MESPVQQLSEVQQNSQDMALSSPEAAVVRCIFNGSQDRLQPIALPAPPLHRPGRLESSSCDLSSPLFTELLSHEGNQEVSHCKENASKKLPIPTQVPAKEPSVNSGGRRDV